MENAFKELVDRGFISNATALDLMKPGWADERFPVYIGFDLTAPSLHVGSLIQLEVMRTLIRHGHRVICLLGGATTKVGDPSGKDKSRPMLSQEEINKNFFGIERVIKRLVPECEVVSNEEWFNEEMSFMDFMRDFGPHFTINRMNTFDTVKRRLEAQEPMTFLEFTYMLLQAVDFLQLFERENVRIQIGGSDQWGNILNGVELVRKIHGEQVFGVTTVLLTDKSGKKMGKTAGGAVWLDAEMTSPFDFFQFWRNVEDEKVEEFEKLFVGGSPTSAFDEPVDINTRKEWLAFQVTALVHGEDTAKQCLQTAHEVFQQGGAATQFTMTPGETVSQTMVRLGFASGRNAARRLIDQNAVSLDGEKISEDIVPEKGVILKVGKKQTAKLL